MVNLIKADLIAKGKKFAIVISRFNEFISSNLLEGCIDTLTRHGAEESAQMDFRGPDRNPDLPAVLDAYRLWRMGQIDEQTARARMKIGRVPDPVRWDMIVEEAEEEGTAFEVDYQRYVRWAHDHGVPVGQIYGWEE